MQWLLNVSTRTKLSIGFGLIILLLLIVAAVGYNSITVIQQSETRLFNEDFNNALDLRTIEADENAVRAYMLTMLAATNQGEQDAAYELTQKCSEEIGRLVASLLERNKHDGVFLQRLQEFKAVREAYARTRDNEVAPLIRQRKTAEANSVLIGIQQQRYEKMNSITVALGDSAQRRAFSAVRDSEHKANQAIVAFGVVTAAALLLSVGIVLFLNSLIASPLTEISRLAAQIATGDVAVELSADGRKDEVGLLKQNFAHMTQSLRATADVARQIAGRDLRVKVTPQSERDALGNAFAAMVNNLRDSIGQMAESVNVLAASASQILSSTTEVAAGAAQTATAITETTTTVEEVKQTAQVSSQKAKHVSDNAQHATQVAQTGRHAVDSSIAGMNRIESQMRSIAESILKLSEQSQAIGEIIATVNDLSEQSNLLAVNAAIEAAKAGEHGRGFAVVAQEIKTLAEQSRQATAQVRAILNDIQKATNAAVMATEQGGKYVEAGVQQTKEAGESIRVLADSIVEASQAATQIAASSQQQLVGMDQVALAMENIKDASNQNLAGTRQSESAANSLNDLGQKLKSLVEQYKM